MTASREVWTSASLQNSENLKTQNIFHNLKTLNTFNNSQTQTQTEYFWQPQTHRLFSQPQNAKCFWQPRSIFYLFFGEYYSCYFISKWYILKLNHNTIEKCSQLARNAFANGIIRSIPCGCIECITHLQALHKFCKPGIKLGNFKKNISGLSIYSSYHIWLCRSDPLFQEPPFLPPPFPDRLWGIEPLFSFYFVICCFSYCDQTLVKPCPWYECKLGKLVILVVTIGP